MKKVYLLMLLNALFHSVTAQNFDWAKIEGKWNYDYGYGIETDANGNVYVAGKYESSADFSGTTLTCAGNHDMFLAKYTPTGALTWIQTAGGILGDYAHAMTTDKTNYVYVAGEIEGTNATVNFSGSATTLTCINDNDIFLAKYDLNGTLIWARSAGGWGGEKALGISYDAAGNVYICGNYKDTMSFAGITTLYPHGPQGERDIFIAKYNSSGDFQWAKSAGSTGRDEALSIKTDQSGNSYICGMYSDGANFGTTTLNAAGSMGYLDAFIAKYDSNGTLVWAKGGGGDYDDVAWSLTMDNAGKVYVAGEFNGYATFGSLSVVAIQGNQLTDAYIAGYNPNTGDPEWISSISGTLLQRARGIGTDGTNILITGQFGGATNFGSTSITAVDSADIFVAGLSNTGTFQWVETVTGPADAFEALGYESGNAVTGDASGLVYATGGILNGGTFGATTLTGYTRTDAFVTRINTAVGINELSRKKNDLRVFPNPSNGLVNIDITQFDNQKMNISVINYLGQIVEAKTQRSGSNLTIDLSIYQKGIYFIEIKSNEQLERAKIIIQ
jgi:hypothetical protein